MKRLSILSVIATLATFIATTFASSACFLVTYQPVEPKCLRDE